MPNITSIIVDDEEECLFDYCGGIQRGPFATAVYVWVACRRREMVPLKDAAAAFDATEEVVRDALSDHPYVSIENDGIFLDGE